MLVVFIGNTGADAVAVTFAFAAFVFAAFVFTTGHEA
jgi:hypothetical protein